MNLAEYGKSLFPYGLMKWQIDLLEQSERDNILKEKILAGEKGKLLMQITKEFYNIKNTSFISRDKDVQMTIFDFIK